MAPVPQAGIMTQKTTAEKEFVLRRARESAESRLCRPWFPRFSPEPVLITEKPGGRSVIASCVVRDIRLFLRSVRICRLFSPEHYQGRTYAEVHQAGYGHAFRILIRKG